MKKFIVINIELRDEITISSIRNVMQQQVKYNHILFEAADERIEGTEKIREVLGKYSHIVQPRPRVMPRAVFSNLSDAWQRENRNIHSSLTEEELSELINFIEESRASLIPFATIVFDGVEWQSGFVTKGTYGYRKASYGTISDGALYFSNAVTLFVSKLYQSTDGKDLLICQVICEEECRASKTLNAFIDSIGDVNEEKEYLVPDNAKEREECDKLYRHEEEKVDRIFKRINEARDSLPFQVNSAFTTLGEKHQPIRVTTIANRILKKSGWDKASSGKSHIAICYSKKFSDKTATVFVSSSRGGHLLNLFMHYGNDYYMFYINGLNFSFCPLETKDAENYFKNLIYILKIIEDELQ